MLKSQNDPIYVVTSDEWSVLARALKCLIWFNFGLETLQARKSKWTPPEGHFASLDFFINKCRHDINKLNFNRNTKFSNLSSEERAALKHLSKRRDIIVKAADKGGALVVWRADLYQKEALRQLSDTSFYAKVDKDLTSTNQQIVKSTINELIVKQDLPATATNLIITTPRTSCFYLKFTNLTTQADLSSLHVVALPNSFLAR